MHRVTSSIIYRHNADPGSIVHADPRGFDHDAMTVSGLQSLVGVLAPGQVTAIRRVTDAAISARSKQVIPTNRHHWYNQTITSVSFAFLRSASHRLVFSVGRWLRRCLAVGVCCSPVVFLLAGGGLWGRARGAVLLWLYCSGFTRMASPG